MGACCREPQEPAATQVVGAATSGAAQEPHELAATQVVSSDSSSEQSGDSSSDSESSDATASGADETSKGGAAAAAAAASAAPSGATGSDEFSVGDRVEITMRLKEWNGRIGTVKRVLSKQLLIEFATGADRKFMKHQLAKVPVTAAQSGVAKSLSSSSGAGASSSGASSSSAASASST